MKEEKLVREAFLGGGRKRYFMGFEVLTCRGLPKECLTRHESPGSDDTRKWNNIIDVSRIETILDTQNGDSSW